MRIAAPTTTPPATWRGRRLSESTSSAKTAPRKGCKFTYSAARPGPTRSTALNQSRLPKAAEARAPYRTPPHASAPMFQSCAARFQEPVEARSTAPINAVTALIRYGEWRRMSGTMPTE
jgi:hypothetical protein